MRRLIPYLLPLALAACAPGLGRPCSDERACPPGLVCSRPPVDGGTAANGICDYPLRQEGETCSQAAECAGGLTCSNHFTPGERYGTCVSTRADGSPCFADRDCASGHCAGKSGEAVDGVCSRKP